MRILRFALLYLALALGANTAAAGVAEISALRHGDMKKLNFHSTPKAVSQVEFFLPDDGGTGTLADYQGKYVVVNFWATWCPPCRKEMPTLSALQTALGGDRFKVVTIATSNNRPADIKKFFDKIGVTNLPRNQDHRSSLARDMGVLGLPTTVIIDPQGREIGRMTGDADWNSDSARAIFKALLAQS